MNERLKELRKACGLNQTELAERIRIKQSTIAGFEKGSRKIRDYFVHQICSELGASEHWLRTGEGTMFIVTDSSIVSDLAREYKLGPTERAIIETFLQLSPEHRAVLVDYVQRLSQRIAPSDPYADLRNDAQWAINNHLSEQADDTEQA